MNGLNLISTDLRSYSGCFHFSPRSWNELQFGGGQRPVFHFLLIFRNTWHSALQAIKQLINADNYSTLSFTKLRTVLQENTKGRWLTVQSMPFCYITGLAKMEHQSVPCNNQLYHLEVTSFIKHAEFTESWLFLTIYLSSFRQTHRGNEKPR